MVLAYKMRRKGYSIIIHLSLFVWMGYVIVCILLLLLHLLVLSNISWVLCKIKNCQWFFFGHWSNSYLNLWNVTETKSLFSIKVQFSVLGVHVSVIYFKIESNVCFYFQKYMGRCFNDEINLIVKVACVGHYQE